MTHTAYNPEILERKIYAVPKEIISLESRIRNLWSRVTIVKWEDRKSTRLNPPNKMSTSQSISVQLFYGRPLCCFPCLFYDCSELVLFLYLPFHECFICVFVLLIFYVCSIPFLLPKVNFEIFNTMPFYNNYNPPFIESISFELIIINIIKVIIVPIVLLRHWYLLQ